MKWTNELPKVPGWYRVKNKPPERHSIYKFEQLPNGLHMKLPYRLYSMDDLRQSENIKWQFSGPIPEPQD